MLRRGGQSDASTARVQGSEPGIEQKAPKEFPTSLSIERGYGQSKVDGKCGVASRTVAQVIAVIII